MGILLILALIVIGGYLIVVNLFEGISVWDYGWHYRTWPMCNPRYWLKDFLFSVMTLPGAILGFVIGILTFRWTDSGWWR